MMNLALQYERVAGWIVSECPPQDKFAHTYAGLAIWLLTVIISGRSLRSPLPLAMVILAETFNETIDRLAHGSWRWNDTIGDAIATFFWPAILTLALGRVTILRR